MAWSWRLLLLLGRPARVAHTDATLLLSTVASVALSGETLVLLKGYFREEEAAVVMVMVVICPALRWNLCSPWKPRCAAFLFTRGTSCAAHVLLRDEVTATAVVARREAAVGRARRRDWHGAKPARRSSPKPSCPLDNSRFSYQQNRFQQRILLPGPRDAFTFQHAVMASSTPRPDTEHASSYKNPATGVLHHPQLPSWQARHDDLPGKP
ncbi:hypothetical protein E2C01_041741 [Portunus trituberculatus]|uniref:Secreted protein n=1 Tax=Portunus trituberculatus TaxID=210409 RepID=A0A5B7FK13_PORTR|nr:hypothetical protein [Portunus trituberculatus]